MPPHSSETRPPLAREPKARPVPGPIFTSRCASAPGKRDGRVIWRASGPCGRKKGGRNAPLEKREHDAYARKLDREFRKLDLQTRAERTYDTVLAPMPVRCGSVYGSRMVERCSSEVAWQVETPLLSCPSTLRRTAFDYRLSANGTAAVARRSPDELRTICTVTLGDSSENRCQCMRMDRCGYQDCSVVAESAPQKIFGRGAKNARRADKFTATT